MDTTRYFLSQDNDCHWYVVPVVKQGDWNNWLNLDEDDERSWDVPDYAKLLNGSPSRVTFLDPEID